MEIIEAINYRKSIIAMLIAEKLPVNDLSPGLENFFVALHDGKVTGVTGLEIYGDYGLLRSLVVLPGFRDQGVGDNLVRQIENLAVSKSLNAIYLLTQTAPEYFRRKGYTQITRADVPPEVQQSSEFSYACPQSAIVMMKTLTNNI
jgi:amino-acid N-acetyltransferase